MTRERAKEILGDKALWELKVIYKALSYRPYTNTEDENERLEAVKVELAVRTDHSGVRILT